MIKAGGFIHLGGLKVSSTILTTVVIALSSAGIIALSLYSDSREDYLYANREQIYILMNSWHSLEHETLNLLVEPAPVLSCESKNKGDDKKWLYSLKTFDTRLKNFLNSPQTKELAGESRLFERKLNDISQLWSTLGDGIERSALQLTERIETDLSDPCAFLRKQEQGDRKTYPASYGGLLYQMGYLSGKEGRHDGHDELAQAVNNYLYVVSTSRVYCTVLLEEMSDIISDRVAEQTAHLRLVVFILSTAIVVLTVFFVVRVQRKSHLYQLGLEQLVSQRTSELEAEKAKAETARLQTEQVNRQLQASVGHANLMTQQTAEASRTRGEFLANTSHGIRTPMNAIIGFSEMLMEENLTEQQKKQVGIIRDSSRHLLQLINDILDYSKIEAGKLDVKITDCAVGNILTAVESLMCPAAIEKRLQFEIMRSGPLPEFIHTDSARLKQCLINLVSNAIKFTDKGHIYVRVFQENRGDKSFIRFDVEDTGIGISSEQQSHIFEPFSQADSGAARRPGGTGLGLAITQHLAEFLGGSVTISSTVGKGSVFSLIIPIDMPSAGIVEEGASVDTGQKDRQLPIELDNLKLHGKVLIAEDSPTNQILIELLLKKLGLETVVVENGQQAVQKAMTEKFDIILMDIQMPVMNGYEATRQLRKEGIVIPIVAVTACAMKGDDEKCFAAGCSDYLSKPVDRKKLVETLWKYLSTADTNHPCCLADAEKKSDKAVKQQEISESFSGSEIEMDWQLLIERVGSEELIDEIMPIFIKDNTERMKMLSEAMEKTDQKEIKFYAHSLKGASATIGAAKISELAKQLEIAARDGDNPRYRPLFEELKVRFARLIGFLSKSDWKQIAQQASLRQHTERS
jgi:signal transduction histidine kinase/DNA-binding response OmpR family regulator